MPVPTRIIETEKIAAISIRRRRAAAATRAKGMLTPAMSVCHTSTPTARNPHPAEFMITVRTERTTVDSDRRLPSHVSRSMKATVTVSPACLPMAVLMSALTGSLWVPAPSAISEVWNG